MTERLRVREIDDDEGRRLVRIVRRGSGSVVTWRRVGDADVLVGSELFFQSAADLGHGGAGGKGADGAFEVDWETR